MLFLSSKSITMEKKPVHVFYVSNCPAVARRQRKEARRRERLEEEQRRERFKLLNKRGKVRRDVREGIYRIRKKERRGDNIMMDSFSHEFIGQRANSLISSNNPAEKLKKAIEFRKLLTSDNPSIADVVLDRIVPKFVEYLTNDTQPQLQFGATWVLTNIASGPSSHTKLVIENGAVPILVHLLSSPNVRVQEQAAWALGNIAGNSSEYRDLVLKAGVLQPLLLQLSPDKNITTLRIPTRTLSNLICINPTPIFDMVEPALRSLAQLVHLSDESVLIDACCALSKISSANNHGLQAIIESTVVPRILDLLTHRSSSIQTPCLNIIGNIANGDYLQTQSIINPVVFHHLFLFLTSARNWIRREACWTISGITSGSEDQIGSVIEAGIIPVLMQSFNNSDIQVKKEAAWAIAKAFTGGTPLQIEYLVKQGCIGALCNILALQDCEVINITLDAFGIILGVGQDEKDVCGAESNEYVQSIEAVSGFEKIQRLQSHSDETLRKKALRILKLFYNMEPVVMDCS